MKKNEKEKIKKLKIDLNVIENPVLYISEHVTIEFVVFLILIIAITYAARPPCFAVWIVIMGSYLVLSVSSGIISLTAFGILFSILYLIDRAIAIHLECNDPNIEDIIKELQKKEIIKE